MKKSNDEDVNVLRIKLLKDAFRLEIEKYLVDHGCSTTEAIGLISMALYEIFESIARTEEITRDQVLGSFVKAFGVWDYLKMKKEG